MLDVVRSLDGTMGARAGDGKERWCLACVGGGADSLSFANRRGCPQLYTWTGKRARNASRVGFGGICA